MFLRETGIDISVTALWLGHESIASTQMYLHADLAVKQRALDKTTPLAVQPNRYETPDSMLEFLEGL